jgi:hypothetical protein
MSPAVSVRRTAAPARSRPPISSGAVGEDGGQVTVAEPARGGGLAERPVYRRPVVQRRQIDRLGHLGPHSVTPRRGGLDQPQCRAVAEGEELGLRLGARPRSAAIEQAVARYR